MEQTEISLGLSFSSYSSSSEANGSRFKRRKTWAWEETPSEAIIDLQLQNQTPLPPDWEQCLDLQSGRMYYVNWRTSKKSWERPTEHKLDLDLNMSMSTPQTTSDESRQTKSETEPFQSMWKQSNNSSGNMVAAPCLNCHLLVMLSTSSPSCPNCKFVHSLAAAQRSSSPKPLETLSLLK